ncbi:MAG: alpha/beta hydrolase family protein [Candidatus Omnitrophota bacterium]
MHNRRYFVPSDYHLNYLASVKPTMAYKKGTDPVRWQRQLRLGLRNLLGDFPEKKVPLNPEVLEQKEFKDYVAEKIVFTSEPFADLPGYFLVPKNISLPAPVVICLQGHTSGMHISLGKANNKEDREEIAGDRDFALQAVKRGYLAFAMEQRCFGERRETKQKAKAPHLCQDTAMHSLILGKTLIGERVWDVMRAIDYLEQRAEVDQRRIACLGNSGGGTITFFTACLDRRIKVAVPSCYYCNYTDSIMRIYHCADNYIPGIMNLADMGDLGGLMAPRVLIIVAGKKDEIFPLRGVKRAFRQTKKIYQDFKAERNLHLLVGEKGHRFYQDLAWPVLRRYL